MKNILLTTFSITLVTILIASGNQQVFAGGSPGDICSGENDCFGDKACQIVACLENICTVTGEFPGCCDEDLDCGPINACVQNSCDLLTNTCNPPLEIICQIGEVCNVDTGVCEEPVAGELLPLDSTALLIGGLSSMSVWMIPSILGLAGAGIYLVRYRARD